MQEPKEVNEFKEDTALPVDTAVSVSEAYEKGKTDIQWFAGLAMPEICIFALPVFYVALWQILTNRSVEDIGRLLRFALGLPRGHAKTTFVKILIAWLIVYDKISFALILCSNSDLAESLLADVHDILSSPNMTAVYGDWNAGLAIDSADTKKAAYHNRAVVLVARGWAAGVRGINLKNNRPDFILCDDVQTRKNDESPAERTSLLKELVGTIFKAIAPRGDRAIVYVGNMYSEECILNQFKKNDRWISIVTGAILSNGKPLWPELFSIEDLKESYEHDEQLGMANIWFAEIMNDPQSIAQSILPNPLPDSPFSQIDDPDGVFITIDPAGFRNNSDDNVIAVHYKHDNKGFIAEINTEEKMPDRIIMTALSLALKHGASLIGVEDVGYQQTLEFWLSHFMKEKNITGIHVVPLSPHGRSKESRIRNFIQELYAMNYYIMDAHARRSFVWQASLYKIGKKDNKDDLLDCIAYGQDVRNEFWHLLTNLKRKIGSIEGECSVVGNNTPF
ncbi:MAG: hypothetical protein ACD_86C00001G0006 [uncultured bacterium]|nr:MAG: hypothetical protein ACD_86C00001G0006 [uncultured bacterium]